MLVENGHDAVVASRWRVSRFADARSTGLEISTGFSVRGRALMRLRSWDEASQDCDAVLGRLVMG